MATRCTHRRPDAPPTLNPERCRSVGDRHSAMRQHLASYLSASSTAVRRLQGLHPRPPDIVWPRYQLHCTWLTADASSPTLVQEDCYPMRLVYASRQSDSEQLRRQSLQCSRISCLEQFVVGPQTGRLKMREWKMREFT